MTNKDSLSPAAARTRQKRHVERPDIRVALIDATEALIREEGYAAATVRRIATRAGLKHQAVFYYFGSLDELLLAVLHRAAEKYRAQMSAAFASEQPLRAIWNLIRDPEGTRFALEFVAMANHNELIREALAKNADIDRVRETAAIEAHLKARGITPRLPPQLVSLLTNSLARLLVQEAMLGIDRGHAEAEAMVDASLSNFESRGDYVAALETVMDEMKKTTPTKAKSTKRK